MTNDEKTPPMKKYTPNSSSALRTAENANFNTSYDEMKSKTHYEYMYGSGEYWYEYGDGI